MLVDERKQVRALLLDPVKRRSLARPFRSGEECLMFVDAAARDAGQSQTARSTRTVPTRNGDGPLQLSLTSVDVLHDLMRDAVGIRDLPANFDEARTGQHAG
jgi:hypothetical protein